MAAHDLDNADHAGIVNPRVLINFHAGGGDVLGCRGEARAVIRAVEVVVNGLGYAHHAAVITNLLHILGNFIAGVHGVVAAVVEEVTDVIFFEDFQNPLVVGIVHIGIGHLIAAGTKGGRGGILQQLQLGGVFLTHIEQPVIQYALDAVFRTQNPCDIGVFQSCFNDAVGAGVDDGRRAAGLTENTCTFQFAHVRNPPDESK